MIAASGIWRSSHQMNTTVTSPQVNTPSAYCRHGSNEFVLDLGSTSLWTNSSRVVSNGNYVMMVVHEDCDQIVDEFNALFQ